jgi:hypothetical protein
MNKIIVIVLCISFVYSFFGCIYLSIKQEKRAIRDQAFLWSLVYALCSFYTIIHWW